MAMVSQNSAELRAIAADIEGSAGEFETKFNALFDELQKKLTQAQTDSSVWWGPKASAFYGTISDKKLDFQNAKANISSMATNLEEQADAWDTFEAV